MLRDATPDDVAMLQYWDTQPHVIESGAADASRDWAQEIGRGSWHDILIAECGGRPIGVLEILDPARDEDRYWGDVEPGVRAIDIWIGEAGDLGNGHGTQMMQLAFERCFADVGVHTILIDPLVSNTRARRFYQRLGFREVGPRRFGHDDCVVYRLGREEWSLRGQRPPP